MVLFANGFRTTAQLNLSPEEHLAKSFMDDMRKGVDVNSYLSEKYIINNNLNHLDWQSDYYLIKFYTIEQISDIMISVQIDHGSGEYCTRFELECVNENGDLKILPSRVIFKSGIYIVVPWRNVEKLCIK